MSQALMNDGFWDDSLVLLAVFMSSYDDLNFLSKKVKESKKTRKYAFDQEKKEEKKHVLYRESDQKKEPHFPSMGSDDPPP